jgi:D-alanyl-D-alanine carboxypeptidase (penicillin-binding protein 5/6)
MPRMGDKSAFRRHLAAWALVLAVAVSAVPAAAGATTLSSDLVDGSSASQRKLDVRTLPDVTMQEGAVVDGDGRVLWARSPDVRRPMASITKIMTAVVALEHTSLSDVVTVPRDAVAVGQSSAGLVAGEKLTMFELLEAMLVKSGNDAAVTIADQVGGTQAGFVAMMNAKATQLGLADTHYANPHGLDAPGHYTTADNLAVLARYAMTKPVFRDIVRQSTVTIGQGKRRTTLHTTDELLGVYQGMMGVKTGNTNGAGYSVVSAAQRQGVALYAIVLGTKSDRQRFLDSKALLDWGFGHYRPEQIANKGSVIAEAPVSSYLDVTVPLAVSQDTTIAVLDVDGTIKRTVSVPAVPAPVQIGQTVGVATFRQGNRVIATVPLVATKQVNSPNPFEAAWIAVVRVWRRIFG